MLKVVIYTGCFLAVVGICLYGYFAIDGRGYDRGVSETEAIWRIKQVEAQEDKIHSIQTLRDSLRSQSLDMVKKVDELNYRNLEDNKYAEMARDSLMDSIMSGRIKLYHPTGTGTQPNIGVDGGGSEHEGDITESQAGCVGEARGELPRETTAFLYGESNRANELVGDYNYLVDYTELIRSSCGAK